LVHTYTIAIVVLRVEQAISRQVGTQSSTSIVGNR